MTALQERIGLVVLGMHRSGTSALSGVLSRMGAVAPRSPIAASESNPKGFFESRLICALNDDILASSGSDWSDWRSIDMSWLAGKEAQDLQERALECMQDEFGTAPLFVLKDPRICRILPFWRAVFQRLEIRPAVLHIHRNPVDVAMSLQRRNGFPRVYGQLLWLRHVLDAERESRGMVRMFLSYEQLVEDQAQVALRAGRSLGLAWPAACAPQDPGFVTPDLQHFRTGHDKILLDTRLSPWLRDALRILDLWSATTERAEDFAELDALARQFDSAAAAFSEALPAASEVVSKARETERLQSRITDLEARLAQAHDRSSARKTVLLAAEEKLREARDLAEQRRATLITAKEKLSTVRDLAEQRKAALTSAEEKLRATRTLLARRERRLDAVEASHVTLRNETSREIATLATHLLETRDELERTRALAAERQHRIAALLASTSWTLTRPLRALSRGFRNLSPKVKGTIE
ncbi:sulfotransferase family protein [Paracoccus ravus]|uniref:sulfotransferase family protein n=1 Tax=Paracoccus ravus TaxID=2447760 RepID=UPI00106E9F86|nr:sulfotransferase [Paracoccus ravus]